MCLFTIEREWLLREINESVAVGISDAKATVKKYSTFIFLLFYIFVVKFHTISSS